MSHAYKLNEDIQHSPQGPQGRVEIEAPPTIYTIVKLMPIEADVFDIASRANRTMWSGW